MGQPLPTLHGPKGRNPHLDCLAGVFAAEDLKQVSGRRRVIARRNGRSTDIGGDASLSHASSVADASSLVELFAHQKLNVSVERDEPIVDRVEPSIHLVAQATDFRANLGT